MFLDPVFLLKKEVVAVTNDAFQQHALVIFRLDYCNVFYLQLPVQIAVASVDWDHIIPVLFHLHWLCGLIQGSIQDVSIIL